MKRVVMADETGLHVYVDGKKLRPAGTTAFSAGLKVMVELHSKPPAVRAVVWPCDRPKAVAAERWRAGSALTFHEIVLCDRVKAGGQTCPSSDVPVGKWCTSCLRATPFDVDSPNKPWRGMTNRERLMAVAAVARDENLALSAVGERYLAAESVVHRLRAVGDSVHRDDVADFIRTAVWAKSASVLKASDAAEAARYVAQWNGLEHWQVVAVIPDGDGWFVRFLKGDW